MQKIITNIIPFKHPNKIVKLGFCKKENTEHYALWKSIYPKELWNDFEDELTEIDRLYTNFIDTDNCDYVTNTDLVKNRNLAVHYYSRLIYNYFLNIADAVKINFIKDVQIWFKDTTKSTNIYTSYKRFTIKVQFNKVTKYPELLVSFDGNSMVLNKSLSDLKDFPPELINFIKFKNKIIKYEKAGNEVKQHIEELYPVLSNSIRDLLKIPRPNNPRGNKYIPYYQNITNFYNNYLNTDKFKNIIPIDDKGFYQIPKNRVHKTAFNSNKLRFNKNTDIVPYNGMKNYGPYKTSPHQIVRFFFIYHKPDRTKAAAKLYYAFRDGLEQTYNNVKKILFPSLSDFIKQPIIIDDDTSIAFDNIDNALDTVKKGLLNLDKKSNTKYVAIYISPISKNETDINKKMLYYQIKEELLKHDITSQVVYKDSIYDKNFRYFLPNIAIALLAKIDGIPWRLDREIKEELIVGVGAFTSLNHNVKYIGSAFCFNNKGEFKGFDSFKADETELLAGAIGRHIMQFIKDNGKTAKRLIIHFYKKISDKELKPIKKMLKSLNLDIPVIIITINKTTSEDNVAFDINSKDLMPISGTYIKIGWNQYLLFNNVRYSEQEKVFDNPFPVKLSFSSTVEGYLDDIKVVEELIDQVYQFSRMYWKSVKQQNLPVTIKYPEMAAEIFPFFEGDKLPDFGKNNLWFL